MKILAISILLVVLSTIVVWKAYPPVRIFAPYYAGLNCPVENICIDDLTRMDEAQTLSKISIEFLAQKLGALSYNPRFIYCSTQVCFDSFSLSRGKADTYGSIVSVIGPKGWKPYIVSHELIHQWQSDKIGFFRRSDIPRWLAEGMAYELSEDPRAVLKEPWQSYRDEFKLWVVDVEGKDLTDAIISEM